MTGAERETLSVLLELVRSVGADVTEVKRAISELDSRVKKMEFADAEQVGRVQATALIAAETAVKAERRALSTRAWLGIAVAIAAAASTVLSRIIDLL